MGDEAFISSIQSRVAAILGWQPQSWRAVIGGYTPAARFVVAREGQSAFVKAGTTPLTARLLNREINAYRQVSAPFMPGFIGCDVDEERPILVTEDLSGAIWPPPWTRRTVDLALDAIRAMHRTPADLPAGGLLVGREAGWPTVAADPAPFLALRFVSAGWLAAALPSLIAAETSCEFAGTALTHLDLRSDNMCFIGGRARIVDWSEACLSNPTVDLGFWLPSLAYEGGPAPEEILPDAPVIAATVAGFFAARAGLPIIPDAPNVRRVQREQLSAALPWAQRALGLPPLDGYGRW